MCDNILLLQPIVPLRSLSKQSKSSGNILQVLLSNVDSYSMVAEDSCRNKMPRAGKASCNDLKYLDHTRGVTLNMVRSSVQTSRLRKLVVEILVVSSLTKYSWQ